MFTANAANDGITDFPILTSVSSGTGTIIEGTISHPTTNDVHLEFFSNRAADESGYGEGQTYLGSTEVNVTANSTQTFRVMLPVVVPVGYFVSATATNENVPVSTSEYSRTVRVTPERTPPAVSIVYPTNGTATNYLTLVRGTATDVTPGSGVARVELIIMRRNDNKYWNGTDWVSAPTRLSTTLQGTTWYREQGLPNNEQLTPGVYQLQASAFDRAGNRGIHIINVTVPESQ